MRETLDAFSASVHDLDVILTRLDAKADALPTREWTRGMIVRGVARTTAPARAVVVASTLALCFVG